MKGPKSCWFLECILSVSGRLGSSLDEWLDFFEGEFCLCMNLVLAVFLGEGLLPLLLLFPILIIIPRNRQFGRKSDFTDSHVEAMIH